MPAKTARQIAAKKNS